MTEWDECSHHQFEADGFIHMDSIFSHDDLCSLITSCEILKERVFVLLHKYGHSKQPKPVYWDENSNERSYAIESGLKNGFREIVMRSPGRFELSITGELSCPHVLESAHVLLRQNPRLSALLPILLDSSSWENIKILNVSLLFSVPGSQGQAWHADGAHVNVHKHEPCHCMNVFIPLADISKEMGPTQFRPGSHILTRNLAPLMLAAKARGTLRELEAPLSNVGDVLIFDYRVLHRGLANTSLSTRPILVASVAKKWFKDVVNQPSRPISSSPTL